MYDEKSVKPHLHNDWKTKNAFMVNAKVIQPFFNFCDRGKLHETDSAALTEAKNHFGQRHQFIIFPEDGKTNGK
jgi:DUF1365 family protein